MLKLIQSHIRANLLRNTYALVRLYSTGVTTFYSRELSLLATAVYSLSHCEIYSYRPPTSASPFSNPIRSSQKACLSTRGDFWSQQRHALDSEVRSEPSIRIRHKGFQVYVHFVQVTFHLLYVLNVPSRILLGGLLRVG